MSSLGFQELVKFSDTPKKRLESSHRAAVHGVH